MQTAELFWSKYNAAVSNEHRRLMVIEILMHGEIQDLNHKGKGVDFDYTELPLHELIGLLVGSKYRSMRKRIM
ncbi:MAG: hypothetical protein ABI758_01025 [Candidatus Woesebacteria bacterium]